MTIVNRKALVARNAWWIWRSPSSSYEKSLELWRGFLGFVNETKNSRIAAALHSVAVFFRFSPFLKIEMSVGNSYYFPSIRLSLNLSAKDGSQHLSQFFLRFVLSLWTKKKLQLEWIQDLMPLLFPENRLSSRGKKPWRVGWMPLGKPSLGGALARNGILPQ